MARIKGQFKVDPPGCRHEVRIMAFNSVTMKGEGKCALCGAPANVEFTLDPPPATFQQKVKRQQGGPCTASYAMLPGGR
jgi:hypothetical protein